MPTIPHGPHFENPANPTDPRSAYNRRWRFLYYLSGVGMMLYNRFKFGMGVNIYSLPDLPITARDYLKPFTDPQLFIAKYELQLPAKEKIQQFLMKENTIKS